MQRLKKHGLTVKNIQKTPVEKIAELIYPVSLYNNKAKHIKKTTDVLAEKYNYDTPKTYEEVIKLPGVGPKVGLLFMKLVTHIQTFDEVHGIGVDTHVHRLSNRLGWADSKTPEQTRKQIESFLPQSVWGDLNLILVVHGQTICKPVKPRCWECKVAELCLTGQEYLANNPAKKTKKTKMTQIAEESKEEAKEEQGLEKAKEVKKVEYSNQTNKTKEVKESKKPEETKRATRVKRVTRSKSAKEQ